MSFKPVLIHRFDNNINNDISNERSRREEIARLLNNLKASLERWYKTPPSVDAVFDFLEDQEPKKSLLAPYVKAAEISGMKVKADKLEEFLEIPNYSHILEMHEQLNGYAQKTNWRNWFVLKEKKFTPPILTKEEKDKIISSYSIFATTEADLRAFKELEKIKEAQNYFADRGIVFLKGDPDLRNPIRRFFVWESRKPAFTRLPTPAQFAVLNYDAFKSPGFMPTVQLGTIFEGV
jgi:hypothetical protein